MNQPERERKKPRGISVTLQSGPQCISVEQKQLPAKKADIEQHFAEMFCTDNHGMRPHFRRFTKFENLCAQKENDIDFKVDTALGTKWLELAEFAPIQEVGRYEEATGVWDARQLAGMVVDLIKKKNGKGYGSGVILMVYMTHDRFWAPPPVVRSIPELLKDEAIVFEAVYVVSRGGTVVEAWPGDPDDQGPKGLGTTIVGPFSGPAQV
ncbi:hypothetical protein G3N59_25465 [Paraburkholderia sp. Ac-20340]|uniref:hypothetical protein n=1 Tax=Paraburkholderia sp. Ac-20340 TaxID=2703888 RepID=UPI001980CA64|nr:hypothetical protein [Paraburkholderia sp. Ac-20340]MBN3856734.1 hypothetical protein [Paraburkholderia sp. Ac-20340]